ncbi:MAG: winged helix DNA-binding domain-containing protein, partial [Chloroflexi bacterium]|nr:winged helix DNA-binding domain-containing protein [Chloroflexota bacterium]
MPSRVPTTDRRRLVTMRLAAQGIAGTRRRTPGDVVHSMLAMQGQDFPGARWSIGLRGRVTDDEVGAAFDAGAIVRSWPMRGTLHVVAAEDVGWMLQLMAPRVVAATATRRSQLGITAEDLERARDAAVSALEGNRALTREALLSALAATGIVVDAQRGYHFLGYLAQTGVIVLGPVAGRQQAFALLETWVRAPRRLERDEALGELARRYFRSHGPAAERDLARWSGLPLGDVRRG